MTLTAPPDVTPSPSRQRSSGYIPSLDGIRALAVLLVAASHAFEDLPIPGRFGVTIFFFLSGFLITTLLVREHEDTGSIDLCAFWARRSIRLMPPLILVLTAAYLAQSIGVVPGTASLRGFLSQLLYFANYHLIFFDGVTEIPGGTVIFWSLAVEEHFYLVYPLLFVALFAARARRLTTVLVSLCVLVIAWRTALVIGGTTDFRVSLSTDTRIDSVVYGCLFALMWNPLRASGERGDVSSAASARAFRRDVVLAALGLLALLFSFTAPVLDSTPGFDLGKVVFSLRYVVQGLALMPLFRLAILHADRFGVRVLESGPLKLIGRYSYTIYLTHFVLIAALREAGVASQLTQLLGALVYSIWFGYLVDRFVDQPLSKLRRRFRHDGRPGIHPATV